MSFFRDVGSIWNPAEEARAKQEALLVEVGGSGLGASGLGMG